MDNTYKDLSPYSGVLSIINKSDLETPHDLKKKKPTALHQAGV